MSSAGEDEFTEVTRGRKKRKALSSPTLPSQRKPGSSEPPLSPPVKPSSTVRNKIPVIISGVDEKFKTWRQLLGELRQYHPCLRINHIKELPKGDLLIIGDSVQDMIILQSESKMKAALGQKVKVSLPKAFQINKAHSKSLVIKGVPTDITESEFKEFLDINKISYAKAERLKSQKDGRVLPIFQLDISDPDEAEALLSKSLACNITGIVYQVEEFRKSVSVMQCFNCQSFGHSAKNCRSKQKCLICGESHTHKGCPDKNARKPKCANCKGPHVAVYAAAVGQKPLSTRPTPQTFQFNAEQLTKFVANVVIQLAQPQVCDPAAKQDMLDLKSSMCRKISNAAKTFLSVDITGKDLFESIGSLSAPAPPKPFQFASTKINPSHKTTSKPSSTLKATSPPNNPIKAVPKQPKSTK